MTTTLLLHGVPETAAIWVGVENQLTQWRDDPMISLRMPGFGTDAPDGFTCTMDEYLDWLRNEVANVDDEVDLIGHDWGGILVAQLATDPPDNLRSWISDAPGALHEGFKWHDLAVIWRTPDEGEAFWTNLMSDRVMAVEILRGFGISEADARRMFDALDDQMVDAILRLYRSSDGLGSRWLATGPTPKPGMVLAAADDTFGDESLSRHMAERMGARFHLLETGGHFWPLATPSAAADAIGEYLASLDVG